MHKECLLYHSPVLAASLKREDEEQAYHFLNASYETAHIFATWLFSGSLDDPENQHHEYDYQLWVLGAELQIPKLQSQVMKRLIGAANDERNGVPVGPLRWIYESTEEGCILRRLAVSLAAVGLPSIWRRKNRESVGEEILLDLMEILKFGRAEQRNKFWDSEMYNVFEN